MEETLRIKETVWAKALAIKLDGALSKQNTAEFNASVTDGRRLPYAYEIYGYEGDETVFERDVSKYETDILIFDRLDNGKWIPRVIIECKLVNINTHEPLAYSAKAATHKHVHPYLRYGILVGKQNNLPARLVRHGINFDFMVTWQDYEPSESEWGRFCALLNHEVAVSRQLQNLLKGQKTKQPWKTLHRRVVLE